MGKRTSAEGGKVETSFHFVRKDFASIVKIKLKRSLYHMVGSLPNKCQVRPDKNLKGITHLIFLKNDYIFLIHHHKFFRTHKTVTLNRLAA